MLERLDPPMETQRERIRRWSIGALHGIVVALVLAAGISAVLGVNYLYLKIKAHIYAEEVARQINAAPK